MTDGSNRMSSHAESRHTDSAANNAGGGLSAYALLCIALIVALGFTLGCSEFIVIGIQPEIAQTFEVTLAQTGLLMSSFSITYALATPILALSTGRFARRPLFIAYCALFCLGNLAAVVASSFIMLLAARVLIGLVSGALLAVGVTYIPELAGMKRISLCVSLVYAAFSVAMVIATSSGRFIAATLDWHIAMVGTFVMAVLICGALVLILPRTGATDAPATAREQLPLLTDPRMLSGMAIFVFGVGSIYVFYGYVTPYLENILGFGTLEASAALMAYGGMCFVSNLLSGLLDTRFGVKALLATFPIQGALLLALWALGDSMPWAFAVILGIGLVMYIVSTPCVSLFMNTASAEYPQALTLASSLEPTAFNTGIAFGTAVGGAVISGPGMEFVGLVGALFSIVAWGLTALTVRLSGGRA
ncbi:MAG: MFS transporter [Coriobacteriaceae bacterium]|nr:MFS transporter [Coriobacteriaceae bacterium]